ncbi:asparaginase domain-containing protein [Mycobacterium leprae]|uniref:asparaginase domain-containing protein n=1 Tax=Mycobacterium leprae TaxID=1769 RepID=UPI0039BEEB74
MDTLAVAIQEQFFEFDGVVVIQGTDTVKKTVYSISSGLIRQTRQPIVFTGTMRGPNLASYDRPANVLAAISSWLPDRNGRQNPCRSPGKQSPHHPATAHSNRLTTIQSA